ncbi:MAG: hypothetical protein LLF98_09205 [Clostridium sp.]|uniref:hypothetical protein n=1 Tax=Clostridium sp. TaxID=1506 RepID=UPI0025C4294A|nr:hypothetical protein [Clostridium sp.]MCE5221420.1 hypothetical protein [Clostridium sp.]
MKKQGSILIEVIASIMILTLTTTFIMSASIQNADIIKKRILEEEVSRCVYNLTNEFKYNISKEEIEELLSDENIGFKYDGDFSKRLLNTDIKDLEQGEDIQVSKIGVDSVGLKLKIVANVKVEKNEVNVENEFTKSWWMDEI